MARQRSFAHIKQKRLSLLVVCPWCHKTQDDHEGGPMAIDCSFRFATCDMFPRDGNVILAWMNDTLLGVYACTEVGYALALLNLEEIVQQHSSSKLPQFAWQVRMYGGYPCAHNGVIARLELRKVQVQQ